ncbi:hypothetical protein [Pseudofulvibacter geojedonensis]|uniref:Adhesin domain-containing protein n=1 Tax=Pseudofulvibacter geojedonensis TaxID=1123758 RepID=A0ABW3I1Q0_9FLAO
MKRLYKVILLLLLPFLVTAHNGHKKGKHTEEKNFQHEVSVSKNAIVEISNKFGDVNVTSWNQEKVKIDVKVSVNGDDKELVLKKLNSITINFSGDANRVKAETMFNDLKNRWGKGKKLNFDITYVVKLPKSNSVNIENKYGNIYLDELDGNAIISCSYGDVSLEALNGNDNMVKMNYSGGSEIKYIKNGKIKGNYNTYKIGKAGDLQINTGYTKTSIGKANTIIYDGNYGGLNIDEIENLTVDANYLGLKLKKLLSKLKFDGNYGLVRIDDIEKTVEKIDVDSNYSKVLLKYSEGANFDFDLDIKYAGFQKTDDVIIVTKENKTSTRAYEGFVGSKNSGNVIIINSNYGGVELKKKDN